MLPKSPLNDSITTLAEEGLLKILNGLVHTGLNTVAVTTIVFLVLSLLLPPPPLLLLLLLGLSKGLFKVLGALVVIVGVEVEVEVGVEAGR